MYAVCFRSAVRHHIAALLGGFYGKMPTTLNTTLYKDEGLDRILREVAWQVVTENPRSGVAR